MGYQSAVSMREQVRLDVALEWHLRYNHYPPLPSALIPVCKRAIDHAVKGEWDARLRLPQGLDFRNRRTMTVDECVESCHLRAFLEE